MARGCRNEMAATFLLGSDAVFLCTAQVSCSKAKKEPEKLSEKDETALRVVVAQHSIITADWQPAGSKPNDLASTYRVLVLPRDVEELSARQPLKTLHGLKKIIEAGAAADAHVAIAYAHAAVGYSNEDPVQLIVACSYAYFPTAKEFDDRHPAIPRTHRQVAVEQVDKLIED